jgi:hypothetical protein
MRMRRQDITLTNKSWKLVTISHTSIDFNEIYLISYDIREKNCIVVECEGRTCDNHTVFFYVKSHKFKSALKSLSRNVKVKIA